MNNNLVKLAEIVKAEDGLEAYVVNGTSGKFNAIFRDTDAGETIGARVCPSLDSAVLAMAGFFADSGCGSIPAG